MISILDTMWSNDLFHFTTRALPFMGNAKDFLVVKTWNYTFMSDINQNRITTVV